MRTAAAPAVAADSHPLFERDLQHDLCNLELQQKLNAPAAGVDFFSENQILVYTVCHTGESPALLKRDDPALTSPHHLKAVVLNLANGTVQQRFDWPTRGLGSVLRVTHSRDLLAVRNNLIQLMTPEGKLIKIRQVNVLSPSDNVFYGLSPGVDSFVVEQSFKSPDDQKFIAVTVLDSRSLDTIAYWVDQGGDWSVAASREVAVRTSFEKRMVQIRWLRPTAEQSDQWRTVWSDFNAMGVSRPVFVNEKTFAFMVPGALQVFSDTGVMMDSIRCLYGIGKITTSQDGEAAGYPCQTDAPAVTSGRDSIGIEMNVYRRGNRPVATPFKISRDFNEFGVALSPAGDLIAVVDRLKLTVVELPQPLPTPTTP